MIERNGDADWFAVTLAAGERYGISVTGTTLSDPWVRLYNSSGTELASDRYNWDTTANLAYTATTAGTYYIASAHSYDSSWSNYTGSYTVVVRGDDYRADTSTNGVVSSGQTLTGTIETSGDEDWFALGATAGTRYSLSLTGTTLSDPWLRVYDSSGTLLLSDRYNWGSAATLSFTADTTERLYVSAGSSSTSSGISGTGTYQLLATSVSDDYSADTSTTGRVTVGESVTGNISFENDNDWFQVSLVAGTRYVMSLNGSITHNGTLADPWLELHDRNGALLTWDDDSGIGSNWRSFTSPHSQIPTTCRPRRSAVPRPAPTPCW